MSMSDTASLKIDERRAFYETPVGKLLRRFENSTAAYWQADGGSVSRARLKEMDAHEDAAREALIVAIASLQQRQASFFVVEQFRHETLVWWRPDGWSDKIGDAAKFHDRDSANYVLTRLCGGVGRSVEHMMVSPATAEDTALAQRKDVA